MIKFFVTENTRKMQDTMCAHSTIAMKESIESTKATIQSIQKDFDTALAKARDDIDEAKLQAETKLNALSRNIEHISREKKTRSFGFCAAFLSIMMWSILIVSMANSSFHALPLNLSVASAELKLLFSSLGEAYDFSVKAAFFTAAAFYPVVVWYLAGWSRRAAKSTKGKIVLVDVGVQTDEFCGVPRGIAPLSESANESKDGSINSGDSVASLTNSDDTIDSYDGEVVHLRAYVEPMRREGNSWKKYGQLHLSLSTINGKPCIIFR